MHATTWNSNLESRTYDSAYYENHTKYYERGIVNFEKFVRENIKFDSLAELGCGTGAFSAPFTSDKEVLGIDFSVGSREMSFLDKKNFLVGDLSKPLLLGRHYDLVISLEVWEHLMPEVEPAYLDNIFSLTPDYLVLSCAVPGQVGRHHYLPHTHSEAVSIVSQFGYAVDNDLTNAFRSIKKLARFYRSNTFVYKKSLLSENPKCMFCGGEATKAKTYCSEQCHVNVALNNDGRAPFKNKDGSQKTVGQYMLKRRGMW